jgi:20S proteasome alpha/beta subunit
MTAGRLLQIENAVAAIDHAAPAVGVLAKDGIVIAGEKKVLSKLLAPPRSSEKMAKIDDHIVCAVAGLTSGEWGRASGCFALRRSLMLVLFGVVVQTRTSW